MSTEEETMTALLRGKVLRRQSNQSDRGWYYEKNETLFLYSDGTFRYHETTFSTVSSGGLSLPSERTGSLVGTWRIDTFGSKSNLLLISDGSVVANMSTSAGPFIDGTGHQYLDGKTWTRYSINS
jgi:hypothetical protein